MTAPATLDEIRRDDVFPTRLLDGCNDALVLFAAGFHGKHDACWIADAGVPAVCVDIDGDKLAEMEAIYPASWEFVTGGCFEYARAHTGELHDLVTVDCPSDMSDQCIADLDLWLGLARHACILTVHGEMRMYRPGQKIRRGGFAQTELVRRSNYRRGCYWLVMEAE